LGASQLTIEAVRDIAELAKLDLSAAELALYTEQLSQILEYFTLLQEVDTSHVELTDSVLPLRSVMRADVVEAALTPEQAIANAPDAEANQFKVSAVLSDE
jgi:aspartyl-tRNA(Asn)/glutamyl-tRNA(Gln) amidotransferase subunit C